MHVANRVHTPRPPTSRPDFGYMGNWNFYPHCPEHTCRACVGQLFWGGLRCSCVYLQPKGSQLLVGRCWVGCGYWAWSIYTVMSKALQGTRHSLMCEEKGAGIWITSWKYKETKSSQFKAGLVHQYHFSRFHKQALVYNVFFLFLTYYTLYNRPWVCPPQFNWLIHSADICIPFHDCVIFHCVYVPQLLHPFICQWE